MRAILGRAERIESVCGSPAYTPETNGSMQRRNTSSPRMRVTHSRIVFFLGFRRRRVPKKRAYARSDFPGHEQLAEQGKFEHAVRAEDELELSFGSLATLTLGQRVELTAVIHPRGQRLVCENQLIRDPELVCDAHDARLCCERVGTSSSQMKPSSLWDLTLPPT